VIGWTLLFGQFEDCRADVPDLWNYSLFNCILMIILLVCNPATYYTCKECCGK
jgi:hypothetical protein